MSKSSLTKLAKTVPSLVREMLGLPPLVSPESEAVYWGMLASVAQSIRARDFITWMLIKDLVDSRIEVGRYRRYKTVVIDEPRRREIERQVERWKERARTDDEKTEQELQEQDEATDRELDPRIEVAREGGASEDEIDTLVDRAIHQAAEERAAAAKAAQHQVQLWQDVKITERDLALSFGSWIKQVELIEGLLIAAENRATDARVELYRHLRLLEEGRDDVIEGEILNPTLPLPRERRRLSSRSTPQRKPRKRRDKAA